MYLFILQLTIPVAKLEVRFLKTIEDVIHPFEIGFGKFLHSHLLDLAHGTGDIRSGTGTDVSILTSTRAESLRIGSDPLVCHSVHIRPLVKVNQIPKSSDVQTTALQLYNSVDNGLALDSHTFDAMSSSLTNNSLPTPMKSCT